MKKLTNSELNRISVSDFKNAEKLPVAVVLDNVRSLNNIGSIFRTADAFRIERICLCGICATPPHREIHKTALGAENSVDWQYYESIQQCLAQLHDNAYKIYAVEQIDDSISLDDICTKTDCAKMAVVFGNEIDGVQDVALPYCDGAIEIPQYGVKHSLNVSCAAAIVMWELLKLFKLQ